MENETPGQARRPWLNARMAVALIMLVGAIRFAVVLDAYRTGANYFIAAVFLGMLLLPFILMSRQSRREAGFVKPRAPWWLAAALVDGALIALAMGWLGSALYGESLENWYIYIRKAYPLDDRTTGMDLWTLFYISAGSSMVFSPLGEEFFYRGLIHRALLRGFSSVTSTLIDSGAFALTHLCHFGLIYSMGRWEWLPGPAAIWVGLMLLAALVFSLYRKLSGSIWGAVFCHAGFNLGMTYWIFFLL